jgi:hypothetical protein
LKEGGVKRSEGLYENEKKDVYILRDMKAIAQNNELKFQRLHKHHPSREKIDMSNIF